VRKLVIMRGAQGVGKSTFIKDSGLGGHVLSADALRRVLSSAVLGDDGNVMTDQSQNVRVWPMLRQIAAERMARGETLVLDMTFEPGQDFSAQRSPKRPEISAGSLPNASRTEFKPWLELASKYGYEVACVDFAGFPIEEAIRNNSGRVDFERVDESRIRSTHETLLSNPVVADGSMHVIRWSPDGSHADELADWLSVPVHDFSGYREVVHVGDLQGCFTVLTGPEGPLKDGLRDDTVYVFVGDLLDRGIENGELLRWFVDHALHRENVILLWGNHEDHLARWSRGEPHVSGEFEYRTLPQLLASGITVADAERVSRKAREFLAYTYGSERVFVTHAGLSTVPARPELVSLDQYSRGTGNWEDPVDSQFERNAPPEWTQVHGHRNYGNVPVRATRRSFNLEDSVETGGCLRTATLSRDGWTTQSYRNHVYRPLRERLAQERKITPQRAKARKALPAWVFEEPTDLRIDDATLTSMREHKGVKERTSESAPHVASLNFTRKVFYDKSWDEVVVKARGLFFNRNTHEIVSRGFEKFFNIGEVESTTLEGLKENLVFPITLYIKENGFLGNMGYERQTDALFLASKSTPDGDFADWFREITRNTLDEGKQEGLRRYLRDTDSAMTFEVIDPVRDPHMIEYDQPKIVLLDILKRTVDFRKAHFDVVQEVADRFGIECKTRAFTFQNWKQFEGWYRAANANLDYRISGKHHEGLVIEDANGFMTKWKSPYYGFWKQMRGLKDRIMKAHADGKEFEYLHTRRHDYTAPPENEVALAHSFRDWCLEQDPSTLASDIITLRHAFEGKAPASGNRIILGAA